MTAAEILQALAADLLSEIAEAEARHCARIRIWGKDEDAYAAGTLAGLRVALDEVYRQQDRLAGAEYAVRNPDGTIAEIVAADGIRSYADPEQERTSGIY